MITAQLKRSQLATGVEPRRSCPSCAFLRDEPRIPSSGDMDVDTSISALRSDANGEWNTIPDHRGLKVCRGRSCSGQLMTPGPHHQDLTSAKVSLDGATIAERTAKEFENETWSRFCDNLCIRRMN